MAILIFHSIQLACLYALNTVEASILIIIDLSNFRVQFLPGIFLQLCKTTTPTPTTAKKKNYKTRQKRR